MPMFCCFPRVMVSSHETQYRKVEASAASARITGIKKLDAGAVCEALKDYATPSDFPAVTLGEMKNIKSKIIKLLRMSPEYEGVLSHNDTGLPCTIVVTRKQIFLTRRKPWNVGSGAVKFVSKAFGLLPDGPLQGHCVAFRLTNHIKNLDRAHGDYNTDAWEARNKSALEINTEDPTATTTSLGIDFVPHQENAVGYMDSYGHRRFISFARQADKDLLTAVNDENTITERMVNDLLDGVLGRYADNRSCGDLKLDNILLAGDRLILIDLTTASNDEPFSDNEAFTDICAPAFRSTFELDKSMITSHRWRRESLDVYGLATILLSLTAGTKTQVDRTDAISSVFAENASMLKRVLRGSLSEKKSDSVIKITKQRTLALYAQRINQEPRYCFDYVSGRDQETPREYVIRLRDLFVKEYIKWEKSFYSQKMKEYENHPKTASFLRSPQQTRQLIQACLEALKYHSGRDETEIHSPAPEGKGRRLEDFVAQIKGIMNQNMPQSRQDIIHS